MFLRYIVAVLTLSAALCTPPAYALGADKPASAAEMSAAYEKAKAELAQEGRYTAHDFYKACTSQSTQGRLACFMFVNGYVRATLHHRAALAADSKLPYCIPENTTPNDVAEKFFSALTGPKASVYGETQIVGATEADFTSLMLRSLWPCSD